MWVARDKDGKLNFFVNEPYRYVFGEYTDNEKHVWLCNEYNICHTPLSESMFPELRWEDEPMEIELVSKMLNAVQEKLAESVEDYFNYVGHIQDIHPYSKEQEQNYYNDMCWRSQDWEAIKYDHPSTWDLNFDDYVGSKK